MSHACRQLTQRRQFLFLRKKDVAHQIANRFNNEMPLFTIQLYIQRSSEYLNPLMRSIAGRKILHGFNGGLTLLQ